MPHTRNYDSIAWGLVATPVQHMVYMQMLATTLAKATQMPLLPWGKSTPQEIPDGK